ncbi:MAG: S-layer homology domain-containing protein [Clostridia bacterium]|nr:S-layer homology domain-containing protein [Clostridia bacterium]
MNNFTLKKNIDGSYTLFIYLTSFNVEFSDELSDREIMSRVRKKYKNIVIKTVKVVLASGMVISIPFSSLAKEDKDKFAMSYVYFGSVATQVENVKRSSKVLDVVSPSYFDLHSDGSLDVKNLSIDFISQMKAQGIKVVPFLSNHWDKKTGNNALDKGEYLAKEIAKVIEKYDLDGVNVDIENVDHTYREKYTNFIKYLREYIPYDKEVSVAVAANPYGWKNGWQGSYDYEKLGEYADYLMIMTYDEHYEGGEEGPVASIDFVRDSIEYALEYVEPEKIVVGVPFFGRIWGENLNGSGVSLNRVNELINTFNAKVYYDIDSHSPVATFSVKSTDKPFYINGKLLKNGNYVVWFENNESLREKFKLINQYDLKGVGNWSAGQEHSGIWDYYELWLSGNYFNDIVGHYAKEDILKVYAEGIMKGENEDSFAPEKKLTRGQAAIIMARVLGISPAQSVMFSDTKGHYAAGYITALAQRNLMQGYSDGSFKPDREMTREEMAAVLSRIVEPDYHMGGQYYSDVKPDMWSYEEISALTKAGIMQGYFDGTFKPYKPVTRAEVAVVLNRLK